MACWPSGKLHDQHAIHADVAGARAATLTLMSNAAGAAAVDLRGAGAVQAGALAQVAPMQLNFRRVRVGKTSGERDIKVRNTGGSPLLISSIGVTGDFAYETDCGASLPAGKSCEIKVKFKPTVAGSRAGELTVANNAVGAPMFKLAGVGANRTRDSGERERERERDDDDDDTNATTRTNATRRPRRLADVGGTKNLTLVSPAAISEVLVKNGCVAVRPPWTSRVSWSASDCHASSATNSEALLPVPTMPAARQMHRARLRPSSFSRASGW